MDGLTLRKYRESAGMSLRVVADEANTSAYWLQAVETGKQSLTPKYERRIVEAIRRIHIRREAAVTELISAASPCTKSSTFA